MIDAEELTTLALNLARNAGYAVFPVNANKKPAIPKREGGTGFLDASRNPEQIERMFSHRDAKFIGIATGVPSAISVLDVDAGRYPENADAKTIERHQAARAWWHAYADRLPATRIYESASGGLHVYFRHRPGIATSASLIHQGIDTRGDGGYIIYWFAAGLLCHDHSPVADWPEWLFELLTAPKQKARPRSQPHFGNRLPVSVEQVVRRALERVASAPDGAKHETLRNTALLLGGVQVEAGFSDAEALGWLRAALPATVKDWRNVDRTATWGLRHGRSAPLGTRRAG